MGIRLVLFLCLLFSLPVSAETVHVAVASNFHSTLAQLKMDFEHKTGHTLLITSGSTGKLVTQTLQGAPYQVLLLADDKSQQALVGKKDIKAEMIYAEGQLCLYSPPGTFLSEKKYTGEVHTRIAIANPLLAPYGQAAESFLEEWSFFEKSHAIVIKAENVAKVYYYVKSGHADAGFVPLSIMLLEAVPEEQYRLISSEHYQPLKQAAVLLSDKSAAVAFFDYLQAVETRQMISNMGYRIPSTLPESE